MKTLFLFLSLTPLVFGHTTSGDFDGDGQADIVLVDIAAGHFTLGFGESTGEFTWEKPTPIPHTSGQATGKRQHKPFTVISSNSGPDSLAFASYTNSRVTIFHGIADRNLAFRSPLEFPAPIGPLGITSAQIRPSTPELELVMPMAALTSPQTSFFAPQAGLANLQTLPNGAIDPSLAGTLTDFALLAPDPTNSSQGRHENDHVGAYNFLLEIAGGIGSQLTVTRLTGPSISVDHIFDKPTDQVLAANMRGPDQPGQLIMWGAGLDSLAIVTVSEGAGNALAIEELVVELEDIVHLERFDDLNKLSGVVAVHYGGSRATYLKIELEKVSFVPLDLPIGSNSFRSITQFGDGLFAMLDDGSFAIYRDNGLGGFDISSQGNLPQLSNSSPKATVMLYTDDPLSGDAFEFNSFSVGQWATGANYAGGQITLDAETFQSTSQGLGNPQAMIVTPTSNPGGSAQAQGNQFGDASSSIFFSGDVVIDGLAATTISPPPGSYDAPILVNFSSVIPNTSVTYRINSQPWQLADGNGFYVAADSIIDFYGQSPGGALGAIQSASYQIDLAFGLDSNSDLLPDDVATAFGLNPFGDGDSDGDGISDANEILNDSDPLSAASTPDDLAVKFPPELNYDILVNVPQEDALATDIPGPEATLTAFQPDGTTVLIEVPVLNGEATISNPSWYEDFDSSQSGQRSDFALSQVSSITFPPLSGDLNEPRGASMFGIAFPSNFPLPQLSPASPVPIPYPTTAQLTSWIDETTTALTAFETVKGLDESTEPLVFNADTTLAVAAFTAWAHQQFLNAGLENLKFPWEASSGRLPVRITDFSITEEPFGAGLIAHELAHTVQQIHREITQNPDYLPLRTAVREMIHVDLYLNRSNFTGHIWNSGQALINFLETGEFDPFYAAEITPSLPSLQALRNQLLNHPSPRPVLNLIGNLIQQTDGTWSIESEGQQYHLFTSSRVLNGVEDNEPQVSLQRFSLGETELLNGLQNSEVHVIGFPIGQSNDLELHSISIVGFNLSGGTVDLDVDGLDDAFENYFLGGLGSTFWDDSDGDGFADGDEFHQGTHPDNPLSFPSGLPAFPTDLTITPSNDEMVITWHGSSAASYHIEEGDLSLWQPSTIEPEEISPGSFEWRAPITTDRLKVFRVIVSFP